MPAQPDSAYALLASIDTDTLNAGSFARWCMLKAELSHRTSHVSVPSIEDMERTLNWYKKQGTEEECLKAGFYLGMAHAHEGESDKAMNIRTHIYYRREKARFPANGIYLFIYGRPVCKTRLPISITKKDKRSSRLVSKSQ